MYFKRRRVLSWVSLSGATDAAETRSRAACLPILPGECSFLRFFLLSFTIQQCWKDFIVSWPETCTPHAATSGIPLAVPHFYCKWMIHLSALATNLDNQGNNLSEKLKHKIRSREMMNEYVHYGLKLLILYHKFSAGNCSWNMWLGRVIFSYNNWVWVLQCN